MSIPAAALNCSFEVAQRRAMAPFIHSFFESFLVDQRGSTPGDAFTWRRRRCLGISLCFCFESVLLLSFLLPEAFPMASHVSKTPSQSVYLFFPSSLHYCSIANLNAGVEMEEERERDAIRSSAGAIGVCMSVCVCQRYRPVSSPKPTRGERWNEGEKERTVIS